MDKKIIVIGAARREIVLPLPVMQGGYSNREQPATEIHDPLYVSCFAVSDGTQKLAVFSFDLLGIYGSHARRVSELIKARLGDTEFVFSCIHSHSAPSIQDGERFELHRDELIDAVASAAVLAARAAFENARPASLSFAECAYDGVGGSRRVAGGGDVMLRTLRAGNTLVVNYNCHPTLMSPKNLLISRDYVGAALDCVEKKYQLAMFLQGACGDCSTRFTRRGQTFDELDRLGGLLGERALALSAGGDEEPLMDFSFERFYLELPLKKYRDAAYYEKLIIASRKALDDASGLSAGELRIRQTALQGAEKEYRDSLLPAPFTSKTECSLLTLNDHALLFIPFELFSSLGKRIGEGSPFASTWIVGYSGECRGYLPDVEGFSSGGYEVASSRYDCTAGEQLVLGALEKLKSVYGERIGK